MPGVALLATPTLPPAQAARRRQAARRQHGGRMGAAERVGSAESWSPSARAFELGILTGQDHNVRAVPVGNEAPGHVCCEATDASCPWISCQSTECNPHLAPDTESRPPAGTHSALLLRLTGCGVHLHGLLLLTLLPKPRETDSFLMLPAHARPMCKKEFHYVQPSEMRFFSQRVEGSMRP